MASPEALKKYFFELAEYAKRSGELFKKIVQDQRTSELAVIRETNSLCPFNLINSRTASPKNVDRALEEGSEDPNILRTLMCLNNSLVAFPTGAIADKWTSPYGQIERGFPVRKYFQNLEQIGSESVEGYATTAQIRGGQDRPFVIKTPRIPNPQTSSNILHEYFVGAFGTNFLRGEIPNFTFVMGVFQCSPPYIDQKKGLTYCQNDNMTNQVYYVLYENVTDSVSFAEFITKGCSYSEYLTVICQILLALDLANEKLDFTHYDLHPENVLIKELPYDIYIPYPQGYLRTRHLAMIIDLGRSHIRVNNKHYGFSLIQGGIYPDRPYYMYDAYKIVAGSLAVAAFGNKSRKSYRGASDTALAGMRKIVNLEVFNRGKDLLRYFYPEINRDYSVDYLTHAAENYFEFPYSPRYDLPVIDFFKRAINQNEIRSFFSPRPPLDQDLIYGCSKKGVCLTLQRAIQEYSQPKTGLIDDPYIFYQVYSQTPELFPRELIIQKYPQYLNKLSLDANKIIREYSQIDKTSISLNGPSFLTGRLDLEMIRGYQNYTEGIVRGFDLMTSLKEIKVILQTLAQLTRNTPEILPLIERTLQNIYFLNSALENIRLDISYLTGPRAIIVRRLNPNLGEFIDKIYTILKAVAPMVP